MLLNGNHQLLMFGTAEPDRQLILKNIMMQLNRSVILECPHLDVPWFHQHYCEDQEEKSRIRGVKKKMHYS